jgi:hypothetical protein
MLCCTCPSCLQASYPWSKEVHALGVASGLPSSFRAAAQVIAKGAHTFSTEAGGTTAGGGTQGSTAAAHGPPASPSKNGKTAQGLAATSTCANAGGMSSSGTGRESAQGAAGHPSSGGNSSPTPPDPSPSPCLLPLLPGELVDKILGEAAWPPWAWSPLVTQEQEDKTKQSGSTGGQHSAQQQGSGAASKEEAAALNLAPGSSFWTSQESRDMRPQPADGRTHVVPFPTVLPTVSPQPAQPFPWPDPEPAAE